jgi:hypothetical protein
MQAREGEGLLGLADPEVLHPPTDRPSGPAQVLAPVVAGPQLDPVDHEGEAAKAPRDARGQQRKIRERGRVDDVVTAAVSQQVPQHAGPEHERREDAPAARHVELHPWPDGPDVHARYLGALAARPLAQREHRDLVAVRGQALAEVAVPALGPAHGVGVQAVVDEADAHAGR